MLQRAGGPGHSHLAANRLDGEGQFNDRHREAAIGGIAARITGGEVNRSVVVPTGKVLPLGGLAVTTAADCTLHWR